MSKALSVLGGKDHLTEPNVKDLARQSLAHCRAISAFSDESANLTRTFLSPATRSVHAYLAQWMQRLGMEVRVDAAGNLRGFYHGTDAAAGSILIGSHLDTVPDAGAYDGVLGVVLAVSLIEAMAGTHLLFGIEVVGFSEEEGVRFGLPFIGSRGLIGDLDRETLNIRDQSGVSIDQAIRNFGLDPQHLTQATITPSTNAYLEFHIEQGSILHECSAPLGIVDAIIGKTTGKIRFLGKANHAGATPMHLRKDALCAAAEWIAAVEMIARDTSGLVATVGMIVAKPGASNVIPGEVVMSIDLRHRLDTVRHGACQALLSRGEEIARGRKLKFEAVSQVEQMTVSMSAGLTLMAEDAIRATGLVPYHLSSAAGHDAVILAPKIPSAMILLRNPTGTSHHPDEAVQQEDVEKALQVGLRLLHLLAETSYSVPQRVFPIKKQDSRHSLGSIVCPLDLLS